MLLRWKIVFFGLISVVVGSNLGPYKLRRHKSCIINGKSNNLRNDVYADELEVEEPAYYNRRRHIVVKIQAVYSCGYRFCKSRGVSVKSISGRQKKSCRYRRATSQFICIIRRGFDVLVFWAANSRHHSRRLLIRKITRPVSIRAVMPSGSSASLLMFKLKSCRRKYPKSIVITEAIQGKSCPSDRRRYPVGSTQDLTKRTLDGRLNNPIKIFNGAVGENLLRLSGNGFADKVSVPAGACSKQQRTGNTCPFPKENNGTGSNRPNPRVISNKLMSQNQNIRSRRGLSDLSVYFGQFLDHDTDLTPELPRSFVHKRPNDLQVNVAVPKGDFTFDIDSKGTETIHVRRFNFDNCTGEEHNKLREHTVAISAVLDANTVYGSDEKRLRLLRTLKNGLMKTHKGFLPLNTFKLKMANPIGRDPTKLHAAGDVRANVAPTLLVLHTLFVREHNRIAKEYKRKHRRATDEEIFQYARKMVIAEMQAITYREYIPSLLGRLLPRYKGYNPKIDTGIATEFSTAAFRFGHSQINSKVFRFDKNGRVSQYGHLPLRDAYLKPEILTEQGGLDPILRGAVKQRAEEIDTKIVDDLRNFLFPKKGTSLDLAAINIQRGRETGIPDYNTVRKKLGLRKVKSFYEITRNGNVARTLKSLYKNVNNLDLWVGGLAEDHVRGSELGPTFEKIFINQMIRLRDGDRFWYTRILSRNEIRTVHRNTLSRIIRLNTGFKNPPKNVFFVRHHCSNRS